MERNTHSMAGITPNDQLTPRQRRQKQKLEEWVREMKKEGKLPPNGDAS